MRRFWHFEGREQHFHHMEIPLEPTSEYVPAFSRHTISADWPV